MCSLVLLSALLKYLPERELSGGGLLLMCVCVRYLELCMEEEGVCVV